MKNIVHDPWRRLRPALSGPNSSGMTTHQRLARGPQRAVLPYPVQEEFRVVALRTVGPAIYAPSWIPTVRIVILWVLLVVIILLTHPAVGVCLP